MKTAIALLAAMPLANSGIAPEAQRIPAEEARQGAASDGRYVYAVDNSRIGKYRIRDGVRVAQWSGDPVVLPHLNSCAVEQRELVCASSNYPKVPHASSVEFFDLKTLRHLRSKKLGATDGSLTAIDFHADHWWATFAHYDGKGGMPGKDHRWTRLAKLDRNFRLRQQWTMPAELLDRLKPYSLSGASWSRDGILAMTGHDRPEVYLVRVPRDGRLIGLRSIVPVTTQGQAISWDPLRKNALWSISRRDKALVLSEIRPAIVLPAR